MVIKEGKQSKVAEDSKQTTVNMKGVVLYGESKAVAGENRGLQTESGEGSGNE